jgi:hypothetical protein
MNRSILYRAAEFSWLSTVVMRNGALRRIARRGADPYLGGETLEEALAVVRTLHADGLRASGTGFVVLRPRPDPQGSCAHATPTEPGRDRRIQTDRRAVWLVMCSSGTQSGRRKFASLTR